jgi:hypothetical protein
MKKTTPIIFLFLLILFNCCGQIKNTYATSVDKSKNESNISLGLSSIKADLILNNHNLQQTGFCFGDGPGPIPQFYKLSTGKILCIHYKYSENGYIVSNISVSTKVYPDLASKGDPEMDAFWNSFKDVKTFNLKTMK